MPAAVRRAPCSRSRSLKLFQSRASLDFDQRHDARKEHISNVLRLGRALRPHRAFDAEDVEHTIGVQIGGNRLVGIDVFQRVDARASALVFAIVVAAIKIDCDSGANLLHRDRRTLLRDRPARRATT